MKIPAEMHTPDVIETGLGQFTSKDGAPTQDTAKKVRGFLTFTNGRNVDNNNFRGASACAIPQGFQSIGAQDNSVVIFSELMDSNSLFLTVNADRIYSLSVIDRSKGRIVMEQPPKSLRTINDMGFSWVIDIGFPGPNRGEGGKWLILLPDYEGVLPDSGFSITRSKTNPVLYAARDYLEDNDPKPVVTMIKQTSGTPHN